MDYRPQFASRFPLASEMLSNEKEEQVTTSGGPSSSLPPFLNFSIRDERSEESHG